MIDAGHDDTHATVPKRIGNALIVGGDNHAGGAGLKGPARHVQDHRRPGNRQQRLARQTRRGVTRRNGDDE